MATYLITGTSRGIGLGLVSDLLNKYPDTQVIATARKSNEKLEALVSKFPARLLFVPLDVNSSVSVQAAADLIATKYPKGIDYIINNAATSGATADSTEKNFTEVFDTNVIGVMRVVQSFLPLVKKSNKKTILTVGSAAGAFPAISFCSKYIEDCNYSKTSLYPYRVSKVAVHYLMASLANDYKEEGIIFVPVHPGQVDTEMNIGENPMPVSESSQGIINVAHKVTLEDSGKLFDWKGDVMQY